MNIADVISVVAEYYIGGDEQVNRWEGLGTMTMVSRSWAQGAASCEHAWCLHRGKKFLISDRSFDLADNLATPSQGRGCVTAMRYRLEVTPSEHFAFRCISRTTTGKRLSTFVAALPTAAAGLFFSSVFTEGFPASAPARQLMEGPWRRLTHLALQSARLTGEDMAAMGRHLVRLEHLDLSDVLFEEGRGKLSFIDALLGAEKKSREEEEEEEGLQHLQVLVLTRSTWVKAANLGDLRRLRCTKLKELCACNIGHGSGDCRDLCRALSQMCPETMEILELEGAAQIDNESLERLVGLRRPGGYLMVCDCLDVPHQFWRDNEDIVMFSTICPWCFQY